MKLLIAALMTMFCITACSGQGTDLLNEMTGVWRFSDSTLLTIRQDNDFVYLKTSKSEIRAKVGPGDPKNKTVNLKVVLPNGMDAVWTLKLTVTSDNRPLYLTLTLHDGKSDVLQFVRRVRAGD